MSHQELLDQMRAEAPALYDRKVAEGKIVDHVIVDPTFAGCWYAMLGVREARGRLQ